MDTKELNNKLKTILAEHLGVETADINDDDDFIADLQMEPTSIFDFQEMLESNGFEVSKIDFKEIHNLEDLIDSLEGAVPDHSAHEEE